MQESVRANYEAELVLETSVHENMAEEEILFFGVIYGTI